ncbi:hypothetical protein M378DRAFT_389541 [Amanita muscaria Koide BX008]|uniref:Uncharacterized protein n=1 Tax=Amanita muscaria (strain Koide BX008) TaxID=946122 RepID=A0A0C2XC53_AMAMK|nr:hypothetical protein M378DRAFT_389541 [Amanita muscaria Koide BX008]
MVGRFAPNTKELSVSLYPAVTLLRLNDAMNVPSSFRVKEQTRMGEPSTQANCCSGLLSRGIAHFNAARDLEERPHFSEIGRKYSPSVTCWHPTPKRKVSLQSNDL